MSGDRYGEPWTRDEVILALYLYCQIPFQQTKASNPKVAALAAALGRTPASVARKLGNLGASDMTLREKGISGLAHTAAIDRQVWTEFDGRWPLLIDEVARIGRQNSNFGADADLPILTWTGATESTTAGKRRRCQDFFRLAVLSSYDSRCCMCDMDLSELLVAAHIVSWAKDELIRADPQNGLCLCVLHHAAFDAGLLTLDQSLQMVCSPGVRSSRSQLVRDALLNAEGRRITLPRRFPPKAEYLQRHYEHTFRA